jgi:hypothetical protein
MPSMTENDRPPLLALIQRDLMVGLVVALLGWGLVNVAVAVSATRETYSRCNTDETICVKRHQSWRIPGFRRVDRIRIGDGSGSCGEDHATPFKPIGQPVFGDHSVVLHGSDGETATYLVGAC